MPRGGAGRATDSKIRRMERSSSLKPGTIGTRRVRSAPRAARNLMFSRIGSESPPVPSRNAARIDVLQVGKPAERQREDPLDDLPADGQAGLDRDIDALARGRSDELFGQVYLCERLPAGKREPAARFGEEIPVPADLAIISSTEASRPAIRSAFAGQIAMTSPAVSPAGRSRSRPRGALS